MDESAVGFAVDPAPPSEDFGAEASPKFSFSTPSVEDAFFEASTASARALDFASVAFFAASRPAWRNVDAKEVSLDSDFLAEAESIFDGVAVEDLELSDGAVFDMVDVGGFEGVFAAEGVGVGLTGADSSSCSFSSPYSFHSSTSSMSYFESDDISSLTSPSIWTYSNDHAISY